MNVCDVALNEIKPYERNPRKNRNAVDTVAESIKEFGFKVPLVIDADGVIVCGHTRYLAAKKLKMETVPCIRADDLTPEQIKAFRLADNRVGEISVWDGTRLELELSDLKKLDFDMTRFAFDPIELDLETGKVIKEDFETHREKTWRHDNFNLFLAVPEDEKTEWGFPILPAVDVKPSGGVQPFSEILAKPDTSCGVHFFVDDYRFARVWQSPEKYTEHLQRHPFLIQPDFSTYTDMPKIMQMWNKWRNHMLAWYWSSLGMKVVPNVMFSDEASYEWCFDGLPKKSTVCVSNVGVMQRKEWREAFLDGLEVAIERLKPKRILFYGKIPKEYDFGKIEVMEFASTSFRGKREEEVRE